MRGKLVVHSLSLVLLLVAPCCRKKSAEDKINPASSKVLSLFVANPKGDTIQVDTFKLGLKSMRKQVLYYLHISGNDKQKTLIAKSINGEGTLTVAGQPEGSMTLPNGIHTVEWKPSLLGTTLLSFQLRDTEQRIRETSVQVTAFDNLPPQAVLKVEKLAQLNTLEYLIDASYSYDRDAKFGGGIVSYNYTIDGKTFVTDRPSINWIFETHGSHTIGVKVSDADGASSTYSSTVKI